jgi:hypothetical protein
MKTMWQDDVRENMLARINMIQDGTPPRWGRMTADRMLSHLVESLKMAVGEKDVAPRKLPLRFLVKPLFIYVLPFPKNVPTSPELLAAPTCSVAEAKAELRRRIEAFPTRQRASQWPAHPAFGAMTGDDWGVLVYRHMDHHLRQFGA